jgi:hypothetical protein
MGLFLVDGLVIGFSCLSRSPVNPLGISVENRGLEIEGWDSRSGLIIGDFLRALERSGSYPRTEENGGVGKPVRASRRVGRGKIYHPGGSHNS